MKKVLLLLIIGVALFLNFNRANTSNKTDITLLNVTALQASAGEAWCDPITSNKCKITLPGGVIIEGIGQPKASW